MEQITDYGWLFIYSFAREGTTLTYLPFLFLLPLLNYALANFTDFSNRFVGSFR